MDVFLLFPDDQAAELAASRLRSGGYTVELEEQHGGSVGLAIRAIAVSGAVSAVVAEMTSFATELGSECVAYSGP